jgi:hypothetical protein
MKRSTAFWPDYAMPIVVAMSVFSVLNFLWSLPQLGLYRFVPQAITVYMVSSLLALGLLVLAFRKGTIRARDIGLAPGAWKPQHRVLGLVATVSLVAFLLSTSPELEGLNFGDYCFWFAFLLQASLAELLVFLSLGFCLPERWLRERGWSAGKASLLAAVFAGVAFGVYHYTHEPRWRQYALVLVPVMWMYIAFFLLTRNFHLTLLFHNAVAAVGFTQEQYLARSAPVPDPYMVPQTYFDRPVWIVLFIVSFVVPYLLLHALEWRLWSTPQNAAAGAIAQHSLAMQES